MDIQTKKKYNYWQWRTLIVLMIGYALFYFVRKNFSIAMPALEAELGLSKTQLGIFLTLNGVIYGVSRFINGMLADRVSCRKMMAIGLALSAVVNIVIGFLPQLDAFFNVFDTEGKITIAAVYVLGSLWLVNGYVQGMGYPPCSSLMANWIKPSELATKQSIWNASHNIGAGLVSIMIGAILGHFGNSAWQWCFFAPAILAIFGALLIFLGLKDKPANVGLPNVEDMDEKKSDNVVVKKESEAFAKLAYKKSISRLVFKNPVIWIVGIADFFVYIFRFTILDWGSMILTQYKGLPIELAASIVGVIEIVGGILGTLAAGWVTDKVFKSCAHRTSVVCLLGAVICMFAFWKIPASQSALGIVFIILASFFIYGPQALLGIAASNQATKRVAASANGLVGIFCYLAPIVSGVVFGNIADTKGWDAVFLASIIFGLVGAVILGLIWKRPATGYETAEKILEEVRAELGEEA